MKGVQVSATAGGTAGVADAAQAQALPNTGLSLLGVVAVGGTLVAGRRHVATPRAAQELIR